MAETTVALPEWAHELKQRYLRGEASQFILHGDVHDLILHGTRSLLVEEFLALVMFGNNKDTILTYNNSTGVRFIKAPPKLGNLEELLLHRSRDKVLPLLEKALVTENRMALMLQYAESLAPAADLSMYSDSDRAALVTLHRWAALPQLDHADNIVLMLTENLSELHPRLVNNARVGAIRIPLPSEDERKAFIKVLAPKFDTASIERLTEITAGLKLIQIRGILAPEDTELDIEARKKFVAELLGDEGTPERIEGLAKLTKGMSHEEIKDLVAPKKQMPAVGNGVTAEMEKLIAKSKRAIIERECAGLLEFVEPKHGFEAVGGMEEVKRELNRVSKSIREGHTARVPMGFLFVGPMGTGKTFVAEAFAKESDLTAVKFGSFRSKWVGATESNLDRILDVISGMGQVIVIIDEVDRALAGNDGSSDGGTESRVIARLKEFMSDTRNRGRILFILMTNRPDLLDTDIKRTGRLDRKIPFFYSQTADDVLPIITALFKRHKLTIDGDLAAQKEALLSKLVGYSNADIEGVVLLASSLADTGGRTDKPTIADLEKAVGDYLPTRDLNVIELMELLAVYEASNRSMLPKKFQDLSPQELSDKLQTARLKVGHRR